MVLILSRCSPICISFCLILSLTLHQLQRHYHHNISKASILYFKAIIWFAIHLHIVCHTEVNPVLRKYIKLKLTAYQIELVVYISKCFIKVLNVIKCIIRIITVFIRFHCNIRFPPIQNRLCFNNTILFRYLLSST